MAPRLRSTHLAVLASLFLVSCASPPDDSRATIQSDVRLAADRTTVEALVPRNATIESLLRQQQVPAELTTSVVSAIRDVFNPKDLRADRTYWVTRTLDGLFSEFRYQIDGDRLLRVIFRDGEATPASAFDVEVVTLPKSYELSAVSAEITRETNSLIAAFEAYGENRLLPLELAEIFAGEVDFNSDLQIGDRFEVLFERAVRNGEFAGYGQVKAAVLHVGNRQLSAFMHESEDGTVSWYDEEGRSMRRPFLRTPLPFDPRVTSGFSKSRFHPVHGVRRAHLGVDFGAPTGTRVYAVAGGVIETAGWAGEAGRLVRIRHSGGYETSYLHLNGFAPGIRAGARVNQGDVIGYVGMSGTATGPHLDYRVRRDGVYLNPMTAFRGMPAGDPIAPDALDRFISFRDEARLELQTRLGDPAAPVSSASR